MATAREAQREKHGARSVARWRERHDARSLARLTSSSHEGVSSSRQAMEIDQRHGQQAALHTEPITPKCVSPSASRSLYTCHR